MMLYISNRSKFLQLSARHTFFLKKSSKLFTEQFQPLKCYLTFLFALKLMHSCVFGSIIYLWTTSAYFQSIHKWKNRWSLFKRLFTVRPREYQWPYTIKPYQLLSLSKARKTGDLPLVYRALRIRAISNWDTRGQNQCWSNLAWFH